MWLPNVIAFYCIDNRFKESSIIQHRPLGAMVSAQRGTSGLSLSTNVINAAVFMNLLENGPDFFPNASPLQRSARLLRTIELPETCKCGCKSLKA